MAQYDPIAIKSGILTNLGTDTLRDDRIAVAGLDTTTNSLVSGDVCQVDATALRMKKAVNTSTSPIVGIYDGESNSVVRKGVVVATFAAGPTTEGETVYLSDTAGALTNLKPVVGVIHEVGVVVGVASRRVLLQPKPVISLGTTWQYDPEVVCNFYPGGNDNWDYGTDSNGTMFTNSLIGSQCTGVVFWHNSTSGSVVPTTFTCCLWRETGQVQLATVEYTATVFGKHRAYFPSPYTIPDLGNYCVTFLNQSGLFYQHHDPVPPAGLYGRAYYFVRNKQWAHGVSYPSGVANVQRYLIDPILRTVVGA